jgi:hypothetical protein
MHVVNDTQESHNYIPEYNTVSPYILFMDLADRVLAVF